MVLALPRALVLEHLERVPASALDLTDEWEYRRRLELAEPLDVEPADRRAVAAGPDLEAVVGDGAGHLRELD